jgi:hypothetical protein
MTFIATALAAAAAARVIDQYLAHGAGGERKKMRAIAQRPAATDPDAQVQLVHQSSRSQRVARAYRVQRAASTPFELGIDQRIRAAAGLHVTGLRSVE